MKMETEQKKCACSPNFEAFKYHMPWCATETWQRNNPSDVPVPKEILFAATQQLWSCIRRFSSSSAEGFDKALLLIERGIKQ